MKLSEYINMRCIIEEYVRLQEWRAEELYKADHWPKHIYATIGICLSKAEWAKKMVKDMDMTIAEWWPWCDGWTNDGSISDEAWKHWVDTRSHKKGIHWDYWKDRDYQI